MSFSSETVAMNEFIGSFGLAAEPIDRLFIHLKAFFGFFTGVPWVWIGFGGEQMGFSKSTSGEVAMKRYWSSKDFYAYGPRLELDVPIISNFSAQLGVNLNRFREDTHSIGRGLLATPSIAYSTREEIKVRLGYTKINSIQNNRRCTSDAFFLNGMWSF